MVMYSHTLALILKSHLAIAINEVKMMNIYIKFRLIFVFICNFICVYAQAGDLLVRVEDNKQRPVVDAVVYVNEVSSSLSAKTIVVDQKDKEFIPYVTVVKRGDAINFPNNDEIRHQVYSFSKSKQFELPLYRGDPASPVVFDKAGAVAMACNIHDWMSAYVYVVNTDKFIKTNKQGQGMLALSDDKQYEILVWHPKLIGGVEATAKVLKVKDGDSKLVFSIALKPNFKAWRAPTSRRRTY